MLAISTTTLSVKIAPIASIAAPISKKTKTGPS